MPFEPPKLVKVIVLDTLGVLLLTAAALFGWLPGPGGIPLFLGGLSLLALNHEWARRWLKYVKLHGLKFMDAFFNEHPLIQWLYDIVGLGLIGVSIWLLNVFTRNLVQSLAIALGFIGIGLLMGNRKRIQLLSSWARRLIKKS